MSTVIGSSTDSPITYSETDYVAVNLTKNVTIPIFSSTTPLMSVNNWIVIQQRIDGSVDFSRNWADYKAGFGNISTNFWLGLEQMHQLTWNRTMKLRIEIQAKANGKWFSAEYNTFVIDPEDKGYAIHVTGYSGDAGDGLNVNDVTRRQNGMKFSTFDRDNDNNQGVNNAKNDGGGGFWLNDCCDCNLNQPYGYTYFYCGQLTALNLASTYQLKGTRMMIRGV